MEHFQSDPAIRASLLGLADQFCEELLSHPVLSHYRQELSIILKGSTAHGYSDRYSDVDLVVFCRSEQKQSIIDAYIRQGLSGRTDGVFLPLGNWKGHYNLDAYEHLAASCAQPEYLWEYSGSRILHDPQQLFARTVQTGLERFRHSLPERIKEKYLECQLQLDWLRQPLRRADAGAVLLYTSAVYSAVCQLLFLLADEPYPCHKWLPYYFEKLAVEEKLRRKVSSLPETLAQLTPELTAGLELTEYPVYQQCAEILYDIKAMLRSRFGDRQWIGEWYLYA